MYSFFLPNISHCLHFKILSIESLRSSAKVLAKTLAHKYKQSTAEMTPWGSLVHRSVEAWDPLTQTGHAIEKEVLQKCTSLDEFLCKGSANPMFWFFQRRAAFLSQKTMPKWSSDRLDDYVLLPASNGFVKRTECFFVSHFWQTKDHPDPNGEYLHLLQENLRLQTWSYIWIDWTCIPQYPRSQKEEAYFLRTLQTMSGIIRNSGFVWFYPPFEARMWILYEVAEYTLTSTGEFQVTTDIKEFADHVKEMLQGGVRSTLNKHGYTCTYDRDKEFLTSWLEVLVLLRRLRVNIYDVRRLLDYLTWLPSARSIFMYTIDGPVELLRYEGTLILGGERYTFTPFPKWEEGKYSANATSEIA
ncbi:hypothetical protein BGZ61DRAFT_454517 [Ilyonectria robusta]|uniref:uncharacterized protein n=1 Tax=Ilyonectria robusta TaxID=1079257 RepID=UPI001E8DAD94|nr:uncharacterized protein BGZ61DRAFT_454517 [Ilyonectria robusta]KAH8686470.1 hypothetical protein BGZ61DRAFT_454517 [Ilyonectria robusta]